MNLRFSCVLSLTVLVGVIAPVARGSADAATQPTTQPVAKASDFIRVVEDTAGARLETADVVYANADGTTVRLVSAVHIAETSYFQALDKSFDDREVVLYEMVKPKDAPVPKPGVPTGSGVGELQRFLKDTLNLDYQLDRINYARPNFLHADLDAETFERLQQERGETFEMMLLKGLTDAMKGQDPAKGGAAPEQEMDLDQMLGQVIQFATQPDMERQIKLMLARNMVNIENGAMGLDGPNGSVIITERNKSAIETLKQTMDSGMKDIAIFYGAAHMPDMSQRLVELGFHPVSTEWRMAWDLTIRPNQPSAMQQILTDVANAMKEQ